MVPSSAALARRMVELAAPGPDAVIAEYGPGTGVFTRRVLDQLGPGQKFFAIEIDPKFAADLRQRFPELHIYEMCASRVRECCTAEGTDHVDRVISGLPWAVFPDALQAKILDGMIDVLPQGGVFCTFAYLQGLLLPAGRHFKQNLLKRFSRVEISNVVWWNFPPAVIYRCIR